MLEGEIRRVTDERDEAQEQLCGERCEAYRRRATRWINGFLVVVLLLLLVAIAITNVGLLWPGAGVRFTGILPRVVTWASVGVLGIVTLGSLVWGSTVMGWYRWAVDSLARFLIGRGKSSA